jgi:hypothetical protein
MPDHESYYDQIKRLVGEVKAASADGMWTTVEVFAVAGTVVQTAGHVIEGIKNPNEHFDEIVRDAERFFDEVIVPLDVPVAPPALEATMEAFARGLIRPALQKLLDAIAK